MLEYKPEKRIEGSKILVHPWYLKFNGPRRASDKLDLEIVQKL